MRQPVRALVLASTLVSAISAPAAAQGELVINGGFESTTVGSCAHNLSNSWFTSHVTAVTAFGAANEADVWNGPPYCYGSPFAGQVKVGIVQHAPPNAWRLDELALTLSAPTVAGRAYRLSCAVVSVTGFLPNLGELEFGLSTSPVDFGTAVFIASVPSSTQWTQISTTFFAPVSAGYLTVRGTTSIDAWNHIDAVSLTEHGPIASCFCASGAPCANPDPSAGCRNTSGSGALLGHSGSTSVAADDFVLTTTRGPPFKSGLYFMSANTLAPYTFGSGLRCVGDPLVRLGPPLDSGASGVWTMGSLVAYSHARLPPAFQVVSGSVWNFQLWYRDPYSGCTLFNLSNALRVAFTP